YFKNHQSAYRTGRPTNWLPDRKVNNLPTGQEGQQLIKDWLWIYGIYLLFTTTLHPWYVLPLLVFSVFTNYRFAALWSFMIFFTYAGYSSKGYTENLWIVFVEYFLVIIYFAFEFIRPKFS